MPEFMRRPHLNALLVTGLIAALLAGIGMSHLMQQDSDPALSGLILDPARSLPDFELTTQHGTPYNKDTAMGRHQLLFFGFTHCPDICPSTLALMRQLRQDLPAELRSKLDFVFVSIDPERDTPEVMTPYLAHFDPAFIGVTGGTSAVTDFADAVGIAFIKVDQGDSYTMDHATALVLLDPQSRIKAYFSAPHKLGELQNTLNVLINS